MTLLVRNEADIVRANLDYHLAQGVDHVIVTDHGSVDGTDELLREYERSGVATVLNASEDGFHQSRRVTHMARLARDEHGADWVIHNDADEFWWPLTGSLRDVLAVIPEKWGQIVVPRRNFLPRPPGEEPFYSRLVYREAQSLNPSGDPLPPKVAHRSHPDVILPPGNHSLTGAELAPLPVTQMLEIFHFPMRSYEQFERKVVQTGLGYEKLDDRSPDVGRAQLKLLELYRAGELPGYYESALLDEVALAERVSDGHLVLDRRLEGFMASAVQAGNGVSRPDGPAARAFIGQALETRRHADHLEQELAATRAQLSSQAQLLEEVRVELDRCAAALRAVRDSRLMRWTEPLRRRWHGRRRRGSSPPRAGAHAA